MSVGVCSQACVTYENFMVDLAVLVRKDKGLGVNETEIRQQVARVIQMEKEISDVSICLCFMLVFFAYLV